MYTRFKSQKAGIKHGLNQIANTARSRIVIPNTDVKTKIDLNLHNDSKLVDPLSLSSSSTSSLSSSSTLNINNNSPTESSLPIFSNDLLTISASTATTTTSTITKTVSTTSRANMKSLKREDSEQEESIDLNCITYVKSLWEQYSSEIGTQNGPLRYEEDTSQCTHLNGFVPFDMESWWAERSISCMINEKPTSKQSNKSNNSYSITNKSNQITSIRTSLDNEFSPIDNNNNERKLTVNKSISYKLATAKPLTPTALHNFNTFQLCFS